MADDANSPSLAVPDNAASRCREMLLPSDYRIEFLCRLLRDDIARAESDARQAAAAINISLSRFRHLFKQQSGVSFARYVKSLRLKRARDLLLTSPLSVKEVATRGGFNDVSHFVRDFKSAYGQSPMTLRAAQARSYRVAVSANT